MNEAIFPNIVNAASDVNAICLSVLISDFNTCKYMSSALLQTAPERLFYMYVFWYIEYIKVIKQTKNHNSLIFSFYLISCINFQLVEHWYWSSIVTQTLVHIPFNCSYTLLLLVTKHNCVPFIGT